MRRLIQLAALVAAAAAGYVVGSPRASTATAVPLAPRSAIVAPALDLAAVRAIMREELATALTEAGPAATPTFADLARPSAEAPPAPTPERLAAYEAAERLVDDALIRGRWSADDGARMRQLVAQLDQDQFAALARTLFPAINRGDIAVDLDVRGPLF
jgi:hypothetical protein